MVDQNMNEHKFRIITSKSCLHNTIYPRITLMSASLVKEALGMVILLEET